MKIVVVVEDGFVRNVYSDDPKSVDEVDVYDLDSDDPERLEEIESELKKELEGTTEIY